MAIAIREVAEPRPNLTVVAPEPPEAIRLDLGKNGKPKHTPSCKACKSKQGHKDGCKAYAASLERLRQWARYEAWLRQHPNLAPPPPSAPCGHPGCVTTCRKDLPYPSATCQVKGCLYECGAHPPYATGRGVPDHEFKGKPTKGLHPASTTAVRMSPDTVYVLPLRISKELAETLGALDAEARALPVAADPTICAECGWSFESIGRFLSVAAEHEEAERLAQLKAEKGDAVNA